MAAMIEERGDRVYFALEVGVPLTQAATFAEALTGNDDDIVLAAERAIRERIAESDIRHDLTIEEVELGVHDEKVVKRLLSEVGAKQPRKPREQDWVGPDCVVCGGSRAAGKGDSSGRCTVGLCRRRVIIVEAKSGDYEQVEHLISHPLTLTADGIELTVESLIQHAKENLNPDAVVVADSRGWLPAEEWLEEKVAS